MSDNDAFGQPMCGSSEAAVDREIADLRAQLAAVTAERDALKAAMERMQSIIPFQHCHSCPVYVEHINAALSPAQTKPEAPKLPTRNGQIQPCGYCGEVGHITGTCPDWKP